MEPNPASPPTLGAQHIWLPTASGPLPIAVVGEGRQYAVHADHLNTPRRLTQEDGQVAWQWAYSAFGDEPPTQAAHRFTGETTNPSTGSTAVPQVNYNLRYPGQYFDKESNLHYNYFRSYDSRTGRYTQGDPIGLEGGFNRFAYVDSDPLTWTDSEGLNPRGFSRRPVEIMPLEGGGGGVSGGGRLPRWNPPAGEGKPTYRPNPAHDPNRPLPRKTPEPSDCRAVYDRSVPDSPNSPRHWWGRNDEGQYYRFSNTNDGSAHYSGTFPSNSNLIPPYVRGRLD
ncbi:RHS repeat-associated core domain-containing protein [Paracidovorax sp. MALMAid1276]|uniref:RHS repeat-associated core domain-containing protein n=1 Tax=Paracidovorax sp. MALMAid1276 TaxID=3411631 RepID=UPI003B9CD658